jgi:hypothetical protein
MTDEPQNNLEFSIDKSNLYLEESFTDLKAGTVKRLKPVRPDGSPDKSRKTVFVGYTNLFTPDGSLPIQNVIAAKELQQAIKRFPQAMQAAVEQLMQEVKKYKQQEQSQIHKPDSRIIVP